TAGSRQSFRCEDALEFATPALATPRAADLRAPSTTTMRMGRVSGSSWQGWTMRLPTIVLAAGLVVAISTSGGNAAKARGTNSARLEGLSLYTAGRFREAIPYFDEVLGRHARDLEILIKRGSCYLRLDQPEKALADFDRVNQYSSWAARVYGATDAYL